MIIGVPKEIKTRENRVGIVPGGVKTLVDNGHRVIVEKGAGEGVGLGDEAYILAGAECVATDDIWNEAEMVMKVKEPIAPEYDKMKPRQILFTYLHLAAERALTESLLRNKVTAIAYETIQKHDGSLPLLTPMSEVAGRLSVQVGAKCLEKHNGGKGILLGGVPGVKRGHVVIIGGGVVGTNAAKIAIGLGARVTMLDIHQQRLAYLDDVFGTQINTLHSNPESIAKVVQTADLVVGAVLVAGEKAPVLVSREMVAAMEPGSVIVDVAVDQGGSIETIRPTTHSEPTYELEQVIHYGVTNIPGDVPQTSTYALTNTTLAYALQVANKGFHQAVVDSRELYHGINCYDGQLCHEGVAKSLSREFVPYET